MNVGQHHATVERLQIDRRIYVYVYPRGTPVKRKTVGVQCARFDMSVTLGGLTFSGLIVSRLATRRYNTADRTRGLRQSNDDNKF